MKPSVAVALAGALLAAACSGDTETTGSTADATTSSSEAPTSTEAPTTTERSTTTTVTVPTSDRGDDGPWLIDTRPFSPDVDGPPLLTTDGDVATRIVDGVPTDILSGFGPLGHIAGDGNGNYAIELLDGGGVPTDLLVSGEKPYNLGLRTDQLVLFDLVTIGDEPWVLYSSIGDPDAEQTGVLILRPLLDEEPVIDLAVTQAPEYGVGEVSAADGVLALSASADLTETIQFIDYEGDAVERPSPTDDIPYNGPPFVTDGVLGPDGTELAYLEGPDFDGIDGTFSGDWSVVVVDADGSEQLRLVVLAGGGDFDGARIDHLDFDGRWIVLSGVDADDVPLPVLVIDTESVDVPAYDLGPISGTITIDDAADTAFG